MPSWPRSIGSCSSAAVPWPSRTFIAGKTSLRWGCREWWSGAVKGVRWVRFRCLVLAASHRILVANVVNQNDFHRLTFCLRRCRQISLEVLVGWADVVCFLSFRCREDDCMWGWGEDSWQLQRLGDRHLSKDGTKGKEAKEADHKANNDSGFHPTKATVGASCDAWSRLRTQDACCFLHFLLALEHPKLVLVESLPRWKLLKVFKLCLVKFHDSFCWRLVHYCAIGNRDLYVHGPGRSGRWEAGMLPCLAAVGSTTSVQNVRDPSWSCGCTSEPLVWSKKIQKNQRLPKGGLALFGHVLSTLECFEMLR